MMVFYSLLTILLIASIDLIDTSTSRKLSATVNPDCNGICEHLGLNLTEYNNIVHVIGSGEKEELHYIWSSIGAPAVLIARTAKDTTLDVDWKKLRSNNSCNALNFTGQVHYSFAAIMTRLFEYDDESKKAKFVNNNATIIYDLEKLSWNDINESIHISSEEVTATFKTSNKSDNILHGGKIIIKMSAFGSGNRQKELPHLIFTGNTSLIDFTIDGLKGTYARSRFVAEMIFVSLNPGNKEVKNFDYEDLKTIDDEYTPSVFQTYNVRSAETIKEKNGGYMQWKPIVYFDSKRKYKSSTAIKIGTFNSFANMTDIPYSIPKVFYGCGVSATKFANLSMVFGVENGKDFYTNSNYSSWTFALGNGSPPKDQISLTVILVISIGLGLPLVMLLAGAIYSLIKKFKGGKRDMLIVNADN